MAKTFEVVDAEDPRVIADVSEGMEPEFDAAEFLSVGGDFWIDCDYLYTPDGRCEDFYVLSAGDVEFGVVHNVGSLSDVDKAPLVRFMESLERRGIYNANRPTLEPIGSHKPFPEQNEGPKDPKAYAQERGVYVIAFRGGVGYCYGLYDMGA